MRLTAFVWTWQIAATVTLTYLLVQDWPTLNWWNWLIIFPADVFLSEIWPIYWAVLRPVFGS